MARTGTYTQIQSYTVTGSSQATVTLSSIPATYTDLVLVINGTTTSGTTENFNFKINGDAAGNYSFAALYGNGTTVSSYRSGANAGNARASDPSTTVFNCIMNFFDYSNTTTYKTIISRGNTPDFRIGAWVSSWRSATAISSLAFNVTAGNIAVGSTFILYGIEAYK